MVLCTIWINDWIDLIRLARFGHAGTQFMDKSKRLCLFGIDTFACISYHILLTWFFYMTVVFIYIIEISDYL